MSSFPSKYVVRHSVKGLDQVEQRLPIFDSGDCERKLGPSRLLPGRNVRSFPNSCIQIRALMQPFPLSGDIPSDSHPDSR